jgi:hypothetical protein
MSSGSAPARSGRLIVGVTDELGIDVDRFRIATGASDTNRYFSGLEIAALAALAIVYRFLSGIVKGAGDRAEAHGERLGAAAVDALADRVTTLAHRAQEALRSPATDVDVVVPSLQAELDVLLEGDVERIRALVGHDDVDRASKEIAELLRDNGFPEARARAVAGRVARRLVEEW